MDRYLCIHAHFYQPPRENPWLGEIEIQDSAHPYHDWHERIAAECYVPNVASRLLDGEGRILDLVSNFAHISFNIGPTLLSWMEQRVPEAYEKILAADRQSREWRGGHGNALAQVYNHIIMPLANSRDKQTQVLWGIKDFRHRFGRDPEGMWLAETAVDLETLDILARHGIRFTILAPSQAARTRRIKGGGRWRDVSNSRIDPSQPYLCRLPSGRTLTLFFYDGPISQAVAFEDLLKSGEHFADRLSAAFPRSAPVRSSCTSPLMGSLTATITGSATWPWPVPCTPSKRTALPVYRKFNNKRLEPLASRVIGEDGVALATRTCQSNIQVAQVARTQAFVNGERVEARRRVIEESGYIGQELKIEIKQDPSLG